MIFKQAHSVAVCIQVISLNDLEIIRNIKRELIRTRKEIEAMNGEEKKKAWKAYAELLTSLDIGTLGSPPHTRQPFAAGS